MAKKLSDDAKEAAKPNLSPDLLQEHYRYIRRAKVALDEATSDYRGCRKRAKAAGIDMRALAAVEALANLDEDEALMHVKHLGYYGKVFGMPWATQPDMFGHTDAPMPTGKSQAEQALFDAEDEGRSVGSSGNPRDGNTHTPGSALHVAWDGGWLRGNEFHERKAEADGGIVEKKPRGRKAKAGNPEDRPAA